MDKKRNPLKLSKEPTFEEADKLTNYLCPHRGVCLDEVAGKKHPARVKGLNCSECDFFNTRTTLELVKLPTFGRSTSYSEPYVSISDMKIL